jgi:hypothetical protein
MSARPGPDHPDGRIDVTAALSRAVSAARVSNDAAGWAMVALALNTTGTWAVMRSNGEYEIRPS